MSGLFGLFQAPTPTSKRKLEEDPVVKVYEILGKPGEPNIKVTLYGKSLFALLNGKTPVLQTNCIPLTKAEHTSRIFTLPVSDFPTQYKLVEIDNTIYKIGMRFHTPAESFDIRLKRDPEKERLYEDAEAKLGDVVRRLITQYGRANIELVKYISVERMDNTKDVNIKGDNYTIDYGNNPVKKIEQPGLSPGFLTFIDIPEDHVIRVNMLSLVPQLVDKKGYELYTIGDIPPLESEMLDDEMEEALKLHNALDEAYSNITPLQYKLITYGSFFDALFVELHSQDDWVALSNMNPVEFENFLRKIFHLVINSHLNDKLMGYYKTRLRSYYGHLYDPAVRGKTYHLVDKLRKELTDERDRSLLKHTYISETVPVIDEHYDNGIDRTWMDHFISNLEAIRVSAKGNIFGSEIKFNLDEIKDILNDKDMDIETKNKLINELLQSIKDEFLGKLIGLISKVELLGDIIGKSFGIQRGDRISGVLVNSEDVGRTEQRIDHVLHVILTASLDHAEELIALEGDLEAAMTDDLAEGGSRLKRKQKLKTTKKRNKKHRKQNKSKRHKGYLRR
jgi:hypothetical protein